jgi:hypothetical protein
MKTKTVNKNATPKGKVKLFNNELDELIDLVEELNFLRRNKQDFSKAKLKEVGERIIDLADEIIND